MTNKNMSYSLNETNKNTDNSVTYESLMEQVNAESCKLDDSNMDYLTIDDYVASEIDYDSNYTKKQLEFICGYYGISKRKKKKQDLVEEIVIFEKESTNYDIVQRRKTMWFYIEEISSDSFLSKFLILE
tara:strand:- start:8856 stop:9242 length:387 start_codon:yes stop_codon:yes gene_type:complete